MKRFAPLLLAAGLLTVAACGSDETASDGQAEAAASSAGVRLVSATDGAAILDDPPEGLVVLDVRTIEEFTEARLDGATMLDFYRADFAEQLAELDRDASYLLYCRSGSRSGQASAMMEALGFSDVAEVDGGILSWNGASLPTVSG